MGHTSGRDRELSHIDDAPGSATWSIQRWDLGYLQGLAIGASCDTPANVIAAFALTNTY